MFSSKSLLEQMIRAPRAEAVMIAADVAHTRRGQLHIVTAYDPKSSP